MSRSLDDIPVGGGPRFPPVGAHRCRCLNCVRGESKVKKTPQLELTWRTDTGEFEFPDQLYITGKALGRLAVVAKHVCGLTAELPDNDQAAALELAGMIQDTVIGCDAMVTIESAQEVYVVRDGPEIGQKKTRERKRVAFAGYAPIDQPPGPKQDEPPTAGEVEDEGLPF